MAHPKHNGSFPGMADDHESSSPSHGHNGERAMDQSLFEEIRNGKKRAFLAAYARVGTLTGAATQARCDISSHYVWKKTDPAYLTAFQRAQEMAADCLEDEASRRALGWDETRYSIDGTPYTVRKYSDTLLIFRLKALKPELYRDSYPREQGQDISDLLKAVLLELHRQQEQSQAIPAAYQALEVAKPALPPPPLPEEDDGRPREDRKPW